MSIESAQAFYSRITTDEALRTQFQQAATQEARNSILQANGYQFTQEEWATVIAQNQATSADSELSNAELTAVSGGASFADLGGGMAYGGPAMFGEDPLHSLLEPTDPSTTPPPPAPPIIP